MAFRGRSACLNFADSAWLISIPPSFSDVKALKQAAIEGAEALHSRIVNVSSSASSTETVEENEMSHHCCVDQRPIWVLMIKWNLGLYYASLAEELMLEAPAKWFSD
jgi:hypothetical protein